MAMKLDANYFATILDPRFNLKWFQQPGNWSAQTQVHGHSIQTIKDLFLLELKRHQRKGQQEEGAGSTVDGPVASDGSKSLKEEMFAWGNQMEEETAPDDLQEEINRYWAHKITPSDICPLE